MDPAIQRIASVPSLDDIARDPRRVGGLAPQTLAALQSQAAVVQAALASEALATAAGVQDHARGNHEPVSTGGLLTAREMAEYLKVPESWVRSEARADRIPKRMVGRYVRFDPAEVDRALPLQRRQVVSR